MNENIRVFDYITLSKRYDLEQDDLKKIVDEANYEFKGDEMMVELHIVRAIRQKILKSRRGALV